MSTTEERVIDIDPDEAYRLLAEHAAGDSYRTIGAHHHMSHEAARQAVQRQSTVLTDECETTMYLAARLHELGRSDEASWPYLAVPFQAGDGWQRGLSLLQHLVDRLRARHVPVVVQTEPTPVGARFFFTLPHVTPGSPA